MDELTQNMAGECLAGRVRTLNRVVTGIFDRAYRPYDIRSSQMNILVVIAAHGPLSPSEVCQRLCLEKSTLSRDLERLVERQWITVGPGEGRNQSLQIAPLGEALIRKVEPAWAAAQEETKKVLGAALTGELYDLFLAGRHKPGLKK